MTENLLEIEDLVVQFETHAGIVRAVDGVSYSLRAGETLAIVGESGCGKSVTAMSILRLIESQGGRIVSGSIRFAGRELLELGEPEMRKVRGNDISMIFQEPMTSLNPVYTVGEQIAEVIRLHRGLADREAHRETIGLLELVGIPDPERRVDEYPHQLSGGMRQRVMIAMALSCDPKLLIADEPTTALDVTIQAQILELLRELQARLGMAVLLITHDLGVVAAMAHRVAVMYAGGIVETADVFDLFEHPRHPYTVGLLESLPKLDQEKTKLRPIEGNVPDALALPSGCRFHPRCPFRFEPCDKKLPALELFPATGQEHRAACYYTMEHPKADLVAETRQRLAKVGAPVSGETA